MWTRPQTITATATVSCVLFVVCCVQPPCCHATAQQRSHHAPGHWARTRAIEEKRMLLCAFDEKRRLLDLVFVVLLEGCLCVCVVVLAVPCYDATGVLGRSCLQQIRPCASHDTCLLPPSFLGRNITGKSDIGRLPNSHRRGTWSRGRASSRQTTRRSPPDHSPQSSAPPLPPPPPPLPCQPPLRLHWTVRLSGSTSAAWHGNSSPNHVPPRSIWWTCATTRDDAREKERERERENKPSPSQPKEREMTTRPIAGGTRS